MLLLVNLSLWQLGGCLILIASAHYALGHWAIDFKSIFAHLKELVALPAVTNHESTWPGEADDEDTFEHPAVIKPKTKRTTSAAMWLTLGSPARYSEQP